MRTLHRGAHLIPGNDLLSHPPARAVPSAVAGLTSVFGMGTGVTLLLWPPGKLRNSDLRLQISDLFADYFCNLKSDF